MTVTTWCTHCEAKLKAKSEAIFGKSLTCPKCQKKFVASNSPPEDELQLAPETENTLRATSEAQFKTISDAPIGYEEQTKSLTRHQRRIDLGVRIIGYIIVGLAVLLLIGCIVMISRRVSDFVEDSLIVLAGLSLPLGVSGGLIALLGAEFGREAKTVRYTNIGIAILSMTILILGATGSELFFPEGLSVNSRAGMYIRLFFAGIATCFMLSLVGIFTGKNLASDMTNNLLSRG